MLSLIASFLKHLRLINEFNGFLEDRREPIHSANEAQTGFENWLEESGSLKRNLVKTQAQVISNSRVRANLESLRFVEE